MVVCICRCGGSIAIDREALLLCVGPACAAAAAGATFRGVEMMLNVELFFGGGVDGNFVYGEE